MSAPQSIVATPTEIDRKIVELLRLFRAGDYRHASRLARVIADDLATLADQEDDDNRAGRWVQ